MTTSYTSFPTNTDNRIGHMEGGYNYGYGTVIGHSLGHGYGHGVFCGDSKGGGYGSGNKRYPFFLILY